MEKVGFAPAGVEPCSTNRSRFEANTFGSGSFSKGSIGFRAGMVPSVEPGFGFPPRPSTLWQIWQLAAKRSLPDAGSPTKAMAGPMPPGLLGRGTMSAGASVAAASAPPSAVGRMAVAAPSWSDIAGCVAGISVGIDVRTGVGTAPAQSLPDPQPRRVRYPIQRTSISTKPISTPYVIFRTSSTLPTLFRLQRSQVVHHVPTLAHRQVLIERHHER